MSAAWKLEGWSSGDSYGWTVKVPGEHVRIEVDAYSQESERIARALCAVPSMLDALHRVAATYNGISAAQAPNWLHAVRDAIDLVEGRT